MRNIIRPATFVLATALLTLSACASPTAPTSTRSLKASAPTMDSGYTVGVGVKP